MYQYTVTFETEEDAIKGLAALEEASEEGRIEHPFNVQADASNG